MIFYTTNEFTCFLHWISSSSISTTLAMISAEGSLGFSFTSFKLFDILLFLNKIITTNKYSNNSFCILCLLLYYFSLFSFDLLNIQMTLFSYFLYSCVCEFKLFLFILLSISELLIANFLYPSFSELFKLRVNDDDPFL